MGATPEQIWTRCVWNGKNLDGDDTMFMFHVDSSGVWSGNATCRHRHWSLANFQINGNTMVFATGGSYGAGAGGLADVFTSLLADAATNALMPTREDLSLVLSEDLLTAQLYRWQVDEQVWTPLSMCIFVRHDNVA